MRYSAATMSTAACREYEMQVAGICRMLGFTKPLHRLQHRHHVHRCLPGI